VRGAIDQRVLEESSPAPSRLVAPAAKVPASVVGRHGCSPRRRVRLPAVSEKLHEPRWRPGLVPGPLIDIVTESAPSSWASGGPRTCRRLSLTVPARSSSMMLRRGARQRAPAWRPARLAELSVLVALGGLPSTSVFGHGLSRWNGSRSRHIAAKDSVPPVGANEIAGRLLPCPRPCSLCPRRQLAGGASPSQVTRVALGDRVTRPCDRSYRVGVDIHYAAMVSRPVILGRAAEPPTVRTPVMMSF
jgi:hypothetical protein